jgi:hypothetical protein
MYQEYTMKRTNLLTFVLGVVLVFSGCNFVMAPDAESETAIVALTLTNLSAGDDGNVSRAVIQGSGFLYIRTIGGPVGDKGPCYGPYNVTSGEAFRTNDIPPGDFDSLLILHSGKQLFTDATYGIDGRQMTFKQIMSMPDAEMMEFLKDGEETSRYDGAKDELGAFFESQTCMGMIEKVSLPAGKTTILPVTLMPITDNTRISLEESPRYIFPKSDTLKRVFYSIDGLYGLTLPVTTGYLNCRLMSLSADAEIGKVAFYNDNGELVPTTKTGTDLATGFFWKIAPGDANKAVVEGSLRLYMYVEYKGQIVSDFTNTLPPYVTVGFKGDGSAVWKSHKLLLGIYDQSTCDSLEQGGSWATQNPVGTTIVNLDANGNGVSIFRANIVAGNNYYFSAQVDVGNHYAALDNLWGVDIATIIPYPNDYVSKGDPALMAKKVNGLSPFKVGEVIKLDYNGFEVYDSLVYFVSGSGSNANSGLSPSSPKLLNSDLLDTVIPAGATAQLYALENLSGLNATMIQGKSIYIKSFGKNVYRLLPVSGLSGSLFSVSSNSSLGFEDIELNASGVPALTSPIINVTASTNGSLYLGPRSSIYGNTIGGSTTAGGVNVYPMASLTMFGSGIYQCRGTQAGAVLIGMNASADLRYSTFQFNVDGGTSASSITYNGTVTAKALTISDNSPDASSNVPENLGSGTWTVLP